MKWWKGPTWLCSFLNESTGSLSSWWTTDRRRTPSWCMVNSFQVASCIGSLTHWWTFLCPSYHISDCIFLVTLLAKRAFQMLKFTELLYSKISLTHKSRDRPRTSAQPVRSAALQTSWLNHSLRFGCSIDTQSWHHLVSNCAATHSGICHA